MLVGSRALEFWIPEFKARDNSDWDFIGSVSLPIPDDGNNCEISSLGSLNNHEMLQYNTEWGVCSLAGLAIMKRSHLHRPLNFDKHITHFHKHLKPYFDTMTSSDMGVYNNRVTKTKQQYGDRTPKLNKSNEDFFDDNVDKKYDHDWLHELYAYEDRPMYESLKNPDKLDLAWCTKSGWNRLTHLQKNQCCAEECYVIATERFLVPKGVDFPAKLAYLKALEKLCTTLTSGWFRDWGIDHYPEIIELFDKEKVNNVMDKLNEA